jgi:hypothetical protein
MNLLHDEHGCLSIVCSEIVRSEIVRSEIVRSEIVRPKTTQMMRVCGSDYSTQNVEPHQCFQVQEHPASYFLSSAPA